MFSSLKKLFAAPAYQVEAHEAYVRIVAQARKSVFYRDWGVADTIDGRFDVIVLHMFLVVSRLRAEGTQEAAEFARVLQEVFFSDMDRSIREMGVSDTGVGKRIKKMAQAFYGRMQAYAQPEALPVGLALNLYRGAEVTPAILAAVTQYAQKNQDALAGQDIQSLLLGRAEFVD